MMAIGVISALRQGGVEVPGDVSVAGFDDVEALTVMLLDRHTRQRDNRVEACPNTGYLSSLLASQGRD